MNAHYLRAMNNDKLAKIIFSYLGENLSTRSKENITAALDLMKPRAEFITDLVELAKIFIIDGDFVHSEEVADIISECDVKLIDQVKENITSINEFNKDNIQEILKNTAADNGLKLGDLMKYVRAFIAGKISSPSVFEIMEIIGKDICIERLKRHD